MKSNKQELVNVLKNKNTAFTDEVIELISKIVLFDIKAEEKKLAKTKKDVDKESDKNIDSVDK